jgi:HEXXH motif-containing protein
MSDVTAQVPLQIHHVSQPDFDLLAGGHGDGATVERLRRGQISKHLLLIRALLDDAPTDLAGGLRGGFALLSSIQRTHPHLVSDVVGHPHVGAWAAYCLRLLHNADTSPVPLETDLGHLANAATTVAIRAGVGFNIDVVARNGAVHLPGLGAATVRPGANTVRAARIEGGVFVDGQILPADLQTGTATWLPVRRLQSTAGALSLSLELDDLDPYRNCHRLVAAERLSADAVNGWQRQLDDAWQLLVEQHRHYAEAIAAGLVALVPLAVDRSTRGVNATSMDAFGAMLVNPPPDGEGLAVALVHEFQHGKLGALLDLVRLHDDSSEARYYAPWRDDPRPLGGLLHGAYAFMGVTDFWRVQRRLEGNENSAFAEFEFARWRERVNRVITVLGSSGRLTSPGERFLAGMRATVDRWLTEPVSAGAQTLADDAGHDHYVSWRIRNTKPPQDTIRQLVKGWLEDDPPRSDPVSIDVIPSSSRQLTHSVRLDLVGLRVKEPERFAYLMRHPQTIADAVPGASEGDIAYAQEQYAVAIGKYRTLIAAQPANCDHWAGLALTLRKLGPSPGRLALLRHPEIVFAVYQLLADQTSPPPPDELADWLAGVRSGEPVE